MNPSLNPNAALQDKIDPRDYQWSEIGHASAPFDWEVGFDIEEKIGTLPVKDQDGSSSCGGQAWSTLAAALEAVNTSTMEERSAKYIYAQTFVPGGGSGGRANADIFVKQGVSRETLCISGPQEEAFYERPQDITPEAKSDALTDKSYAYVNLSPTFDTIAQGLRDNSGVVIGIDGENNGTWQSAFPLPPSQVEWRHWIYVGKAKMIDGKKYLGLLNSWGITTGDKGWQWISEDYIRHIWAAWTHVFNANPVPPSFRHNFMVNLAFGQSGVDIVALQTALQIEGVFPANVPATGFYGGITASAVLKFRSKYGVSSASDPVGHNVGPLTREQLNKLFN